MLKNITLQATKLLIFFLSEIENFKAYLEENLMINLIVKLKRNNHRLKEHLLFYVDYDFEENDENDMKLVRYINEKFDELYDQNTKKIKKQLTQIGHNPMDDIPNLKQYEKNLNNIAEYLQVYNNIYFLVNMMLRWKDKEKIQRDIQRDIQDFLENVNAECPSLNVQKKSRYLNSYKFVKYLLKEFKKKKTQQLSKQNRVNDKVVNDKTPAIKNTTPAIKKRSVKMLIENFQYDISNVLTLIEFELKEIDDQTSQSTKQVRSSGQRRRKCAPRIYDTEDEEYKMLIAKDPTCKAKTSNGSEIKGGIKTSLFPPVESYSWAPRNVCLTYKEKEEAKKLKRVELKMI